MTWHTVSEFVSNEVYFITYISFSVQALALTNSEFRTARNNGLYFSLIPTIKKLRLLV